jgi:hypothetical protein
LSHNLPGLRTIPSFVDSSIIFQLMAYSKSSVPIGLNIGRFWKHF